MGPQIQKIIKNGEFDKMLTKFELRAWRAFKAIVTNFIGNIRTENCEDLVIELFSAYKEMGCNLALKIPKKDFCLPVG